MPTVNYAGPHGDNSGRHLNVKRQPEAQEDFEFL